LSNFFINTLLIQRKRDKEIPANDPINKMIAALDDGYSLIIFPEGTRGEPEIQQPLKPGVALVLSQRPQIRYIPAYMKGMGKAMPKDDGLIVPHNSSLVYGAPTAIVSTDIDAIMQQIASDFDKLKSR
jgi:1-acyl-sn-glycerol-3-phosphate acyltransferase